MVMGPGGATNERPPFASATWTSKNPRGPTVQTVTGPSGPPPSFARSSTVAGIPGERTSRESAPSSAHSAPSNVWARLRREVRA
jgi:hypothetical protein